MPGLFLLKSLPPSSAVVGTQPAVILDEGQRMGLVIVNLSDNIVSLSFGPNDPVLYAGVTLYPRGTFSFDEYMFGKEQVRAIASGEGSVLAIQEWI